MVAKVGDPKYLNGSNSFLFKSSSCLAIIVSKTSSDCISEWNVWRSILTYDGVSCSEKKEVSQDLALPICALFLALQNV